MSDTPPNPNRPIVVETPRRRLLTKRQIIIAVVSVGLIVFVLYATRNTSNVSKDESIGSVASAHIVPWSPKKEEPSPVIHHPVVPIAMREVQPQIVAEQPRPPLIQDNKKSDSRDTPAVFSYSLPQASASAVKARAEGGAGTGVSDDVSGVVYKSASIEGNSAVSMGDTSLVLMPGLIRCVLINDIVSDLPGPFQCMLEGPAKSDDGVVLMDRGTLILGDYSAGVSQGQSRLQAAGVTAYLPTKPKCAVSLGGPMADSLGVTGMPGDVDNHMWERFGGAVMLSLADSLFGVLQASVSKGNNTYLSFNSGGISSLSSEALRNTINIPPTISTHHGEAVTLWVNRPTNFNHCYKLGSPR